MFVGHILHRTQVFGGNLCKIQILGVQFGAQFGCHFEKEDNLRSVSDLGINLGDFLEKRIAFSTL